MSKYSKSDMVEQQLGDSLVAALDEQLNSLENTNDLNEEQIAALDASEFALTPYDASGAERTGYSDYSYWGATLRMFFKNKLAVIMLGVIAILLTFTFIQPLIPGQYGPNEINNYPDDYSDARKAGMQMRNLKPAIGKWFGGEDPGHSFIFGTNDIGQDLWSRIWSGTRTSLFIGFAVAIIQTVVGIIAGMLWGYVRQLDFIFTEIYNIVDNIPSTIILILAAYIMKPSVTTMIVAMSITRWIGMARFIRNQVLMIRDRDFNLASRCLGTPTRKVIVKNLLPHMVSVIMLQMALAIPGAIGSEVFMTYIGLGLPLEMPSLGNLVNTGRQFMMSPSMRYQLWFPAVVLSTITICFYLVGNAFADAADPRNHV